MIEIDRAKNRKCPDQAQKVNGWPNIPGCLCQQCISSRREDMNEYMVRVHEEYCTVDEIIEILKKASSVGKGDYLVDCNDEYWLARKGDIPGIDDERKIVTLGGYCD